MRPAGNSKKARKRPFDLTLIAIEIKAASEGVRAAVAEHKRRGQSVIVWQDGKVVELPPEEIPEEPEE